MLFAKWKKKAYLKQFPFSTKAFFQNFVYSFSNSAWIWSNVVLAYFQGLRIIDLRLEFELLLQKKSQKFKSGRRAGWCSDAFFLSRTGSFVSTVLTHKSTDFNKKKTAEGVIELNKKNTLHTDNRTGSPNALIHTTGAAVQFMQSLNYTCSKLVIN